MFKCTQGKGFEISFPNGLTASVQWGPLDPCSNDIDLKAAEELRHQDSLETIVAKMRLFLAT